MNFSPMNSDCKSIFKKGRKPSKQEYTQVWIDLINQIEHRNSRQAAETNADKEQLCNHVTGMACSDFKEE